LEQKTEQIKRLTDHLINKYGSTNIAVTDYWDGDNYAIGLSDKTKQFTIYISHWNKPKDLYFVSLENPPTSEDLQYSEGGDFDNLTAEEVEKILTKHLKIS
jgi:hypothetical protein